jgi:hypothetical protein
MTERRSWTWRETSATAAALVVGVLLGPYVMRASQPLPFVSDGGRVITIGELDDALLKLRSGEGPSDPGGSTIGLSFRTDDGQFCRSFALNPGPAGLACRERGDWVVEVLARNPRPRDGSAPAGYRQAGIPFPTAIRDAVQARLDGDLLTPADEEIAIAQGWKARTVLKDANP